MNNEYNFGIIIREKRLEKNITMDYLAKKVGVSRMTLSYIEANGKNCSIKTILRIADYLDLNLSLTASSSPNKERKRATRTNTLYSINVNKFIIMAIEQYAAEVNKTSSYVYKKMYEKGIIDDLKNDYEDLHGMSTEYLNQYIGTMIGR